MIILFDDLATCLLEHLCPTRVEEGVNLIYEGDLGAKLKLDLYWTTAAKMSSQLLRSINKQDTKCWLLSLV